MKWTEDMNEMVSTGRNKMLEMLVSAGIIDSKEEVVSKKSLETLMKYLEEKDMMVNFPLPDGSELYPALGMKKRPTQLVLK